MSLRAHIATSLEPLREGSEVEAICGQKIKNSVFVFRSDSSTPSESPISTLMFCAKCTQASLRKLMPEPVGNVVPFPNPRIFVYGVIAGEEAKQEE